MANKIILKKSSTASKVPLATDLEIGEIAVNLADQKLYTKNAGGTVILVGSGISGAGDVVGPASATDNAITRFDTTTGKLIQNSTVTIDDNGNIDNVNALTLDTTPTTLPTTAGSMYWDTGNKTPSVVIDTDVALQLGQEMLALVYNGTGSTITNGSVVAVSGAQGQRPSVVLADADSEALSAPTLGVATEDIANGAEGFVTTFGFVRGINTSAFTAGAPVYLSQTAGQFTATRPSAPAHTVALGWVIKVNASSGELFVNINNGWELDELHNVLITSPISGNTLIYDASVGVWKNANLTGGTGITVTNGAGSITLAIDSTVATLSGTQTLTNKTISGASNTLSNIGNFSLTNSSITINGSPISLGGTVSVGTVTSVSGTAPISVATGTSTPAISISQASSTTNGYLSSTDWNTFNNKTSNTGTVTSVAMTVPTGLSIAGTPITTSGTLALTLTAGYSIPTTASQTNWDSAYTQRLQWDGGSTNLVAATGRTSLGGTTVGQNFFTLTNPTAITFPRINADNTVSALDAATFRTAIGAGTSSTTGTVTSVGGTGTVSGLTLSGTVTTSGNLTLGGTLAVTASNFASQTAKTFLAAPNGIAGTPTFRTIVAADVPTLNQNTTGTASNVTGVVAIANGGTGATTRQNAMDALAGAVTSGQYLRGNGTDVVMSTIQAADVPTLNQNTTGSAATLTTGRTIAITGDLTYTSPSFNGSANVTAAGTLATVNANVGSFGSSTAIPVVTVNAKGLVTAVSTATVAGGQYFGSAAVKAIAYNANTISENITVTAGNNGLSAGPITISTGFTVTVETGAAWVIV